MDKTVTDKTMAEKTVLFLVQRPPYGTTAARDTVDAILACASFGQPIQVLFAGDGVWQLTQEQAADNIGMKDIGKLLSALPYYDVTTLFAEQTALATRNIHVTDSCIPVTALNDDAIRQLVRNADHIIAI